MEQAEIPSTSSSFKGHRTPERTAFRITLAYLGLASLWIVLSDLALRYVVAEGEEMVSWQILKGIFFILATSLLLFLTLRRAFQKRQASEAEVQKTEALYRTAITAANAVPYHRHYQTNRFLFIGPGIQKLTGYKPEEFTPALWETISQETVLHGPLSELTETQAILKFRSGNFIHWNSDCRIRRKDGTESWVSDVSVEILDDKGHPTGSIGILMDINDRILAERKTKELNEELERRVQERTEELSALNKKLAAEITERSLAERKLAREHSLTRTLIDHLPDVIFVKDRQGRFLLNNVADAQLMGTDSPGELLNKTDFDFYPYDLASLYWEDDKKVMETGQAIIDKEEPSLPDSRGRVRWIQVSKIPFHDPAGQIVGLVGIGKDITRRRESEQQIKNLHASIERISLERKAISTELQSFVHSVAHDLRAPLRSIDGFYQTLKEDYGGQLPEEGKHCLERMKNGLSRLNQMMDALIGLTEMSRAEMKRETVNLSQLAGQIGKELQRKNPDRKFRWEIESDLFVEGDPALLRTMLLELFDNAVKFAAMRSEIQIEFYREQHEAHGDHFSVRDNGVGFDMKFASKLFAPFQRLHSPDEFDGLGVGLSRVKRILIRHGGRIQAFGAEGEGAKFTLFLPR